MNKCPNLNFEGLTCPYFVGLDCENCNRDGEMKCAECEFNTGCQDCLLSETEE